MFSTTKKRRLYTWGDIQSTYIVHCLTLFRYWSKWTRKFISTSPSPISQKISSTVQRAVISPPSPSMPEQLYCTAPGMRFKPEPIWIVWRAHVTLRSLTHFLEPRACLLAGWKDNKTNLISQKLKGLLYIIIKMFYKLLQFFISGLSGYFRFYPLTPDVCRNHVVPRTANWLF